jgi:hypothetical protein
MDTSQITITVAVITGVSGFAASMVNLALGLRKQRAEDRKASLDERLGITASAGNIVSSANQLTALQEKVFDSSIEQYKIQIVELKNDVLVLKNQAETNKKAIEDLNVSLFALKERDASNSALIKKLVRGIKLLVAQITEEKLVPRWTLSEAGLDDLKV